MKIFGLRLTPFEETGTKRSSNSLDFDCTWYFHLRVNIYHLPSVLFGTCDSPTCIGRSIFCRGWSVYNFGVLCKRKNRKLSYFYKLSINYDNVNCWGLSQGLGKAHASKGPWNLSFISYVLNLHHPTWKTILCFIIWFQPHSVQSFCPPDTHPTFSELADLTNKNTECSVIFEFQINYKFF